MIKRFLVITALLVNTCGHANSFVASAIAAGVLAGLKEVAYIAGANFMRKDEVVSSNTLHAYTCFLKDGDNCEAMLANDLLQLKYPQSSDAYRKNDVRALLELSNKEIKKDPAKNARQVLTHKILNALSTKDNTWFVHQMPAVNDTFLRECKSRVKSDNGGQRIDDEFLTACECAAVKAYPTQEVAYKAWLSSRKGYIWKTGDLQASIALLAYERNNHARRQFLARALMLDNGIVEK